MAPGTQHPVRDDDPVQDARPHEDAPPLDAPPREDPPVRLDAPPVDETPRTTDSTAEVDEDVVAPTTAHRWSLHDGLSRIRGDPTPWLLGAAIVVWFIVFARLGWERHARFATWDFDLGHHDQAIWLLAHGRGFITVSGMPVLGHHLTLAYFGVVPLFWLGGGPQLLNILQTAALALSAVPIYLLARDRLRNDWLALALGVVWLLNPSVQWLSWEGWHPETMAIPFLLAAYLFARRQQFRWYWVALVVALSWKEDVAIAVAVLGVVLALSGRRRVGLATFALGVLWFVIAYGVVMRQFTGGINHAGIFYGDLGTSPTDLMKTAVTDPGAIVGRLQNNDALGYARDLLAPFGFLPLLAPGIVAIAVPQFLANSLTTADFFYDIRFHYVAIILAALAIATIEGIALLRRDGLRRFAVGLVAASALATSVAWGMSPISTTYRNGYWALAANPRQSILDAAVDAVPDDAAVAASYYIVPHLSHRRFIYTFPNPWIPANWGVAGVAPDDPTSDHLPEDVDWIVLDRTTHAPGSREETLLNQLLLGGEFEIVSDEQGIVVARRVSDTPTRQVPSTTTTTTPAAPPTSSG